MIFVGHCITPDYEIYFGTLFCHEEAYIKFEVIWNKFIFGLISKLIQKWITTNPKC